MNLIFGCDEAVAEWVCNRIPHAEPFGECVGIGVADDAELLAGVVFDQWSEMHKTLQLSMAADSPRWAKRGIVYALLSYAFDQAGAQKLWTATPISNERALKFNLGVGFTKEAVLGHHFGKEHAVICRMYRKDFEARYRELRQDEART